jgi:site-specific DNA-methyltransferase (adenine-specific)
MENVARHGTGALNVGACRVGGRHPANVITSHAEDCAPGCPLGAAGLDDDALAGAGRLFPCRRPIAPSAAGCEHLSTVGAHLRFEKPRRRPGSHSVHNPHPTIKPIALMRWLIRLTCPADGLVLDPFCGSGSTGAAAVLERRRFLGVEIEPAYVQIAAARIDHWQHRRDQGDDRLPLARRAGRRRR